jgi:hypothetical protein
MRAEAASAASCVAIVEDRATRPAAANVLQQQGRFDTFVHRFNQERPHQRST